MKNIQHFVNNLHYRFFNFSTDTDRTLFLKQCFASYNIWCECLHMYENFLEKQNKKINIDDLSLIGNVRKKEVYITGTVHDTKNNYVIRIREQDLILNEVKILDVLKNEPQYNKVLAANKYCFISKYTDGITINDYLCLKSVNEDELEYILRKIIKESYMLYSKYNIHYITGVCNAILTQNKEIFYFDLAQAQLYKKSQGVTFFHIMLTFYTLFTEIHNICIKKRIRFYVFIQKIKDIILSEYYK